VFLAPGLADPARYLEVEMSPAGVLFDALVRNPDGRRETMRVDTGWDAEGLVGRVARPCRDLWTAELLLPWPALEPLGDPRRGLRANFYRVERPRGEAAQFSAWSPTGADPPDFHKPGRFGRLELGGAGDGPWEP
jgi:hypothetical protein